MLLLVGSSTAGRPKHLISQCRSWRYAQATMHLATLAVALLEPCRAVTHAAATLQRAVEALVDVHGCSIWCLVCHSTWARAYGDSLPWRDAPLVNGADLHLIIRRRPIVAVILHPMAVAQVTRLIKRCRQGTAA